jgi:hypothetical protein
MTQQERVWQTVSSKEPNPKLGNAAQSNMVASAMAVEHIQELETARSSVSGLTIDAQTSSSLMQ